MPEKRVLVVQCCRLPQFSYVADRLRERHPDWRLEGLLCAHPRMAHYRGWLLDRLEAIHLPPARPSSLPEMVILPLLNRGYRQIKKRALSLGPPCWESNYEGEIRPLRRRRLAISVLKSLHPPAADFALYLRRFPHHPLGSRVLLLQSCHASLLSRSRQGWERLISSPENLTVVQKDSPWKLWKQVAKTDFDGALVFLSGEPGFAFMKWLPFLLSIPRVVVVTDSGDLFTASPAEMFRFFAGRIRHGVSRPRPEPRVLVVQTEGPAPVLAVVRRLRQDLYPGCRIHLLCREEDRTRFEGNPDLDQIICPASSGPAGVLKLRKQIRLLDVDLACAIFSGRPVFRRAKLFFLSLPVRPHLVFNSRLECYQLGIRNLHWLLRRDESPAPADIVPPGPPQRVLLFQTESSDMTLDALAVVRRPSVVPRASIRVFCSSEQRGTFEGVPGVTGISCYRRDHPLQNMRAVWGMLRWRPQVTAAILSGRPVFHKQKLLFCLFPARHRLVLNENLDCYFLGWKNLGWLVAHATGVPLRPSLGLLLLVRGLLFLPRLAYLLGWATLVKLRRALWTGTPGAGGAARRRW